MKKWLAVILILVFAYAGFVCFVGNGIKVDFYFLNIQKSFFDDFIDETYSYDKNIEELSESLGLKKDVAKKIYENPNDYGLVFLRCVVTNNTPFEIYDFRFSKKVSQKQMHLIDYYFGDTSLRKIEPKEISSSVVAVIVRDINNFDLDELKECCLKINCLSGVGFLLSTESSFEGYVGEEQLFLPEALKDLSDIPDYTSFFTFHNYHNKNYNLESSYKYLTKSPVRLSSESNYRFTVFEDDEIKRYGFTFFDKEGNLIGGAVLNKLLESESFDIIKPSKSTFEDVLSIDKAAYTFVVDKDILSYHYLEDGSYLRFTYDDQENGKLTVVKKEELETDFDWISELIDQDYSLIKQ